MAKAHLEPVTVSVAVCSEGLVPGSVALVEVATGVEVVEPKSVEPPGPQSRVLRVAVQVEYAIRAVTV